jgi:hypothetical protein
MDPVERLHWFLTHKRRPRYYVEYQVQTMAGKVRFLYDFYSCQN